MASNEDLLLHIMELKVGQAETRTEVQDLRIELKEHQRQSVETRIVTMGNHTDLVKIKSSVKAYKWVIGFVFGLPGAVFAILKVFGFA